MTVQELEGYHGQVLQQLRKSKAEIGSIIRLTSKSGEMFEGTLIPRSEYSDQTHVVLKMKNGYNIGISLDRTEKLAVIGQGEKDRKSTRLNSSHDQISYAVFCLKKKS